jgi:hypothetical protein
MKKYLRNCAPCFIAIQLFAGAGCTTTEPLSNELQSMGYAAAVPAPERLLLGSIYETASLRSPYAPLDEVFTDDEVKELLKNTTNRVSVADIAGTSSRELNANADIVGRAAIDLAAGGAKKYKVTYGGVTQHKLSTIRFEDIIYPKIKSKLPGKTFDRKFVTVDLLHVETMEYEFQNDKGGKVDITPGSGLETVLKGKFGAKWARNSQRNLSIKEPRFIGFRMSPINDTGLAPGAAATTGGAGKRPLLGPPIPAKP